MELYLQAWYYPLRSLYSRLCPNTLRLCRNCTLWDLTSLSPQTVYMTENTMLAPQPAKWGGFPMEEEEGGYPPGLALSLQREVSSTCTRTQELRSRHKAHRLRIRLKSECLLKACSDNLAQSLVLMGRREGTPQ